MTYTFDQIFAVDEANPSNVAQNATVLIFAPGDTAKTPLTLTTPAGVALANPVPVNANGFGSAFMQATLDRVAWEGGGFTGFFTSYDGMKNEAVAARDAANASALDAAASAALVSAPADAAIAAAVDGNGATEAALTAAYVPKWKANTSYAAGEPVLNPTGDVVTAKVAFISGASYSAANWNPSSTLVPRSFNGVFSGASEGVLITDTSAGTKATVRYEDTSAHEASVVYIAHRGAGTAGGQAYGINIANHVGARPAVVVHQYSGFAPAVQIDNTDVNSGIYIKNTENQTQNPGNTGTGNFLQFKPYVETDALFLTDGLQWLNRTATKDMSVASLTPTSYTFGVLATATGKQGLYVSKSGTGAGAAVNVANSGTGNGVSILQTGLGEAFKVTTTAAASGVYAARISGQAHGLVMTTTVDGGNTADVDKQGTGNGIAFKLRNLGTGDTMSMLNAGGVVARFSAAGEYENYGLGTGIIVRSANGTRYRVAVSDAGAVTATAI